jgi:pullulanase
MKRFFNTIFIFVLISALLVFAATVVYDESPRQTWKRIVGGYDLAVGIKPTPGIAPLSRPIPPQTSVVETPVTPSASKSAPAAAQENPDLKIALGATYSPEATTFRLFAPTAKSVFVVLYDEAEGGKGRLEIPFHSQQNGIWEIKIGGDLSGRFYAYRLEGPEIDSRHEALDPYATNSVASSTRGRITVMPPPLAPGPAIESPTDMIIYEIQVRDFSISPTSGVKNQGLYMGLTEPNTTLPADGTIKTALDHLSELGVTDVQILPVVDFENDESRRQYNWGYCPVDYFSPEGMFATNINDDSRVRELRALVEALHARGIGVILDVVYNHTGDTILQAIAPKYYYRYYQDGTLANGSACGNEVRTEAPMARKLVIDSLKYWATQYGVDGFRFDFMSLIDKETMVEAERELHAINPHIVLYGEPWDPKQSPLQDRTDTDAMHEMPVGSFNSDFKDALKGSGDGTDPGWIQNGSRVDDLKRAMMISSCYASPAQSINYMSCHDNLVLWDKLKISMPPTDDHELIQTMKLGYLALLTSQGVPFIHGGEDFARSKGGNNNSYDAPDSVNEVDWSLKKKNFDLFTYVRDLISLRKSHPLFRLRTRAEIDKRVKFVDASNGKVLIYTIDGEGVAGETWKDACVVLNSDDHGADVTLPAGDWTAAIDAGGAAAAHSVSGSVNVPQKSGLVFYRP